MAPGRMKRVEKGLECTLLILMADKNVCPTSGGLFGCAGERRKHGGDAAEREGLLHDIFAGAAEEQSQPHGPEDAKDRAAIGEGAVRQACEEAAHRAQVTVFGFVGQAALEI